MNPTQDEWREYADLLVESLRNAEALIKKHSANHANAEHERTVWFNENSQAQAALGRVRELSGEWEACGCRPVCWHPTAAKSLRIALGEA